MKVPDPYGRVFSLVEAGELPVRANGASGTSGTVSFTCLADEGGVPANLFVGCWESFSSSRSITINRTPQLHRFMTLNTNFVGNLQRNKTTTCEEWLFRVEFLISVYFWPLYNFFIQRLPL